MPLTSSGRSTLACASPPGPAESMNGYMVSMESAPMRCAGSEPWSV